MAAGSARRFGRNKLLYPIDGIPLIERTMAALPASLFSRAVVVSAYPDILSRAAERGYLPVENTVSAE